MKFDTRSAAISATSAAVSMACLAFAQASSLASSDHPMMPMSYAPPAALEISKAHSFAELMDNADARMHYAMASAARTGNPDHDFASSMIPHHQGAVDMAKIELLYGSDPILRRIAQEIIVTQQQEIAVMQRQIDAINQSAR
jgi:uncharacterized protein (DUF305 family)